MVFKVWYPPFNSRDSVQSAKSAKSWACLSPAFAAVGVVLSCQDSWKWSWAQSAQSTRFLWSIQSQHIATSRQISAVQSGLFRVPEQLKPLRRRRARRRPHQMQMDPGSVNILYTKIISETPGIGQECVQNVFMSDWWGKRTQKSNDRTIPLSSSSAKQRRLTARKKALKNASWSPLEMHLLVQETDKDRSIYGIQIFSAKRDLLYNTNRPSTAERKKTTWFLSSLREHRKNTLARMFGVTHASVKTVTRYD